jgi:hypothetical protein
MTTPIVEIENGKFEQCCEICADREFPGWDIEEQDDLLDLLSDEN